MELLLWNGCAVLLLLLSFWMLKLWLFYAKGLETQIERLHKTAVS